MGSPQALPMGRLTAKCRTKAGLFVGMVVCRPAVPGRCPRAGRGFLAHVVVRVRGCRPPFGGQRAHVGHAVHRVGGDEEEQVARARQFIAPFGDLLVKVVERVVPPFQQEFLRGGVRGT